AFSLYPDPGRLAALRVERHDGQCSRAVTVALGPGERDDRRADGGGLHDVVPAALGGRALPLPDPQVHVGDDDALAAEPPHVAFQLLPRVVPRVVDQLGPAGDLGVARTPAG